MTYDKNKWKSKLGLTCSDGWWYLPVANQVISEESSIELISLNSDNSIRIKIYGTYMIEQGGGQFSSLDMCGDMYDYYSNEIRGKVISYARFNHDFDLEIAIGTDFEVKLIVSTSDLSLPIEKWEYNYRDGYFVGA